MRCLTAIVVALAVSLAAVQAPAWHVHEHESTQRHPGALFHTHIGHAEALPAIHPELRDFDPEDDARFQHWFSATGTEAGYVPVVLAAVLAMPRPRWSGWRRISMRPSAHDPPRLHATPPRAPPV